ncbi:MAG: hypothetical protein P8168_12345 [Deltaproteobacteria bacterium]|jgi:hypothetical protein
MKKAVLFILLGIFLLFGVSLLANFHMFQRLHSVLADKPGDPPPAPGTMSWNTYKRVKLELGSFDLVNGLTKHELETLSAENNLGFYYLVGCLWLVLGLRLGLRRPGKSKSRAAPES